MYLEFFNILFVISSVWGQKKCKLFSKLKAIQDLELMAMNNKTTSEKVQMQYMDMPYPAFSLEQMDNERKYYGDDPINKKEVLLHMPTETLSMLNHYLYKGKETFSSGFRVLIAGGGTGNSVVFIAEQLRQTDAEIVYLDFSHASMVVAQERADIRQLQNIKWVNDKIENIPLLDLGKFDFIDCSGVLHHLPDPDKGLTILGESLSEQGGMAVMVYGRYGRTGLYQIQDLVRLINGDEDHLEMVDEIRNVKNLIRSLSSRPFGFQSFMRRFSFRDFETDIFYETLTEPKQLFSGSVYNHEVYDRFCHSQDRAFSVPELDEWATQAGLHFVDFSFKRDKYLLSVQNLELEFGLRKTLNKLKVLEKYAFAELFHGSFDNHNLYLSKQAESMANIEDIDNVLYFYGNPHKLGEKLDNDMIKISEENPKILSSLEFEISSSLNYGKFNISFPLTNQTKYFLGHLLEGKLSTGEILREVNDKYKIAPELMLSELRDFYKNISHHDLLLLRDKTVKDIDVMRNSVLFRF